MGRQVVGRFDAHTELSSSEEDWLTPGAETPAPVSAPHTLSRVFGWVYQFLLWSILILGAVHTIHQRVLAPDLPAGNARAAASRSLDFLGSLLFR